MYDSVGNFLGNTKAKMLEWRLMKIVSADLHPDPPNTPQPPGIWSVSSLFATYPIVIRHITGCTVLNLPDNVSKHC